jgi:hypothetical protein
MGTVGSANRMRVSTLTDRVLLGPVLRILNKPEANAWIAVMKTRQRLSPFIPSNNIHVRLGQRA